MLKYAARPTSGIIIMWPSYRPRYASCLSVCPSICLSVCPVRARNSKTNKRSGIKWYKRSQETSKWSANFQLKRSKVKVTGCQKPEEIVAYLAYVYTYGRRLKRRRLRHRLQTTPYSLLSGPHKHNTTVIQKQESPVVADKPARRLRKVCTVYVRAVGL